MTAPPFFCAWVPLGTPSGVHRKVMGLPQLRWTLAGLFFLPERFARWADTGCPAGRRRVVGHAAGSPVAQRSCPAPAGLYPAACGRCLFAGSPGPGGWSGASLTGFRPWAPCVVRHPVSAGRAGWRTRRPGRKHGPGRRVKILSWGAPARLRPRCRAPAG